MADSDESKIAAMDAEPSLEEFLRGWAVLELVGKADGSSWSAYVEAAASGDGRFADGTGPTIDAAIRNAIANAQEGDHD